MLNYWKFILAGIFWSYSKSCAVEMLFQTICVHSIWYSSIFISFPTNTQPNQDCRQFKLQLTIDLSSQGCLSRMQSMLVRKQKILINVLCMLHEFIINRSFRWRPVKDVCPAGSLQRKPLFLHRYSHWTEPKFANSRSPWSTADRVNVGAGKLRLGGVQIRQRT